MYPINAASPERIAVGAVVLIADGTVQTSGVTVSVTKQGGSETGSAGTIAYSTGGIVFYTPTQGETNATSFIVTAYKASCIPAAVTVVTTASSTPGNAGLDWGKVINPTTAVNLSGTNIDTDQVVASVSGAVGSVNGLTASNLDTTVSSRLASASYTAPLDAAGTRTAVGLASANLDTQLAAVQADLPQRITKNVALAAFPFKMVLSTDHVTPATGMTVTATRMIDGAAFGACANAVSEVSAGWYKIDLAAADLNGNTIGLKFTATGADQVDMTIVTEPT